MKTNELLTKKLPEVLYSIEMEERLETINLPAGELIENCCTKIFDPCLCVCECKTTPTPDYYP
jgi:hypothetical protein